MQLTQFEQNYYDKGKADGIRQANKEIIYNIFQNGYSIEEISKLVNLPIEEVSDILKK